jgi:hypothetical protein
MESKRQAEKLRHEAEKAELDFMSAKSMAEAHAKDMAQTQAAIASKPQPTNGFPAPASPGGYPSYGIDTSQATSAFAPTSMNPGPGGEKPSNEGFGMGAAMGGGGGDGWSGIPTPPQSTAGDDPYGNPF